MTLQELYESIGGDYDEVMGRLRMEKLVAKFVVKFLDDPSSEALVSSWAAGDEEATFEAAHSAKGVCSNLALCSLAEPASEITEALRPGNEALRASTDIDALVEHYASTYRDVAAAIGAFAETQ